MTIAAHDPEAARDAMLRHLAEVKYTWDTHPEQARRLAWGGGPQAGS